MFKNLLSSDHSDLNLRLRLSLNESQSSDSDVSFSEKEDADMNSKEVWLDSSVLKRNKMGSWNKKFLFLLNDGRIGYTTNWEEESFRVLLIENCIKLVVCYHNFNNEYKRRFSTSSIESNSNNLPEAVVLMKSDENFKLNSSSGSESKLTLKCTDLALIFEKDKKYIFRMQSKQELEMWLNAIKRLFEFKKIINNFNLEKISCKNQGLNFINFLTKNDAISQSNETSKQDVMKEGILIKRHIGSIGNEICKTKFLRITTLGKMYYSNKEQDLNVACKFREIDLATCTIKEVLNNYGHRRIAFGNVINDNNYNENISRSMPDKKISNSFTDILTGDASNNPQIKKGLLKIKRRAKTDRKLCRFSIIGTNKCFEWQFEAESEKEKNAWCSTIKKGIMLSLARLVKPTKTQIYEIESPTFEKRLVSTGICDRDIEDDETMRLKNIKIPINTEKIKQLPGNDSCADCGMKNPDWISINLGVILCINCAGIHRELGSHVSKIRSLDLDIILPDQLILLENTGNQVINGIWYGALEEGADEHFYNPYASVEERKDHITDKYIKRCYFSHLNENYNEILPILQKAVLSHDTVLVFHCLLSLQYTSENLDMNKLSSLSSNDLKLNQLIEWYLAET